MDCAVHVACGQDRSKESKLTDELTCFILGDGASLLDSNCVMLNLYACLIGQISLG